jgi:hypothetical protein
MATLLRNLQELPLGSHAVSFHTSDEEEARNAFSFLAGAPPGQTEKLWTRDQKSAEYYRQWATEHAPEHVGCIAILPKEQVEERDGVLRPIPEVMEFVQQHTEGISAMADTLSHYWSPETVPAHLEYEAWFDQQPRESSRFLCPYDLRRVPPERAIDAMRELGAHHSHATLSTDSDPAVRLIQLFLFPHVASVPPELRDTLDWARTSGFVHTQDSAGTLFLTLEGAQLVRAWHERVTGSPFPIASDVRRENGSLASVGTGS